MSDIQIFSHPDFGEIRTIEEDNKTLFCGNDVAKMLGYSKPLNALAMHCKSPLKQVVPHPQSSTKTIEMLFIPEGDVYRLITHSKLPGAERFERWVFDDVLPSIRRHGMYAVDELLDNPDFAIKAFTALREERARSAKLVKENFNQKKVIDTLKPKARYCDMVLKCEDIISITKIAKDYGKSGVWLNKWLYNAGIQYKQGMVWLLYQKHADLGYTQSFTEVVRTMGGDRIFVTTYWTQKGRLFIYELLKKEGILPKIERESCAPPNCGLYAL